MHFYGENDAHYYDFFSDLFEYKTLIMIRKRYYAFRADQTIVFAV